MEAVVVLGFVLIANLIILGVKRIRKYLYGGLYTEEGTEESENKQKVKNFYYHWFFSLYIIFIAAIGPLSAMRTVITISVVFLLGIFGTMETADLENLKFKKREKILLDTILRRDELEKQNRDWPRSIKRE